jgi:hypothetical protein
LRAIGVDNRIEILKDLDWQYWRENCSWMGNHALNRPMETMKQHLEKKGYVEDLHIKSCNELIHMILRTVDRLKTGKEVFHKGEYIRVFDLISIWIGWGGARAPYVKPKDNTTRQNFDHWIEVYAKAAVVSSTHWEAAYLQLREIPYLRDAATHHLHYWGGGPPMSFPTRRLLFENPNKANYVDYRSKLDSLSSYWKTEPNEVQKSLFGFSERYFKVTGKLTLIDVDSFDNYDKDFQIVRALLSASAS